MAGEKPGFGRKIINIQFSEASELIDKKRLFHTRWQLKDDPEAESVLSGMLAKAEKEELFSLKAVYGCFRCVKKGEGIDVEHEGWVQSFNLKHTDKIGLSGYFANGIFPVFACTVGGRASAEAKELFEKDLYSDYFFWHGLSVELAETLAQIIHHKIAVELGFKPSETRRFSPGYPAWHDLEEQRKIFALLKPEEIGITLTTSAQMVPEQSVTAVVVSIADNTGKRHKDGG